MVKIRKPNVQQLLPREQEINNGHKVRRQSVSQEWGSRLSSFVINRIFTKGDSSVCHIMTSVLGAACHSTDKEQRIYEKQHVGILLLNIPWWFASWHLLFGCDERNGIFPENRKGAESLHPPCLRDLDLPLGAGGAPSMPLLALPTLSYWSKFCPQPSHRGEESGDGKWQNGNTLCNNALSRRMF